MVPNEIPTSLTMKEEGIGIENPAINYHFSHCPTIAAREKISGTLFLVVCACVSVSGGVDLQDAADGRWIGGVRQDRSPGQKSC